MTAPHPVATFPAAERCPTCGRVYTAQVTSVVGASAGGVTVSVVTRYSCACGTFDEAGVKV